VTVEDTYAALRVLDLSTNLAGPLAAMILGDLGADVVKVERPPIGDETRALPPDWHGESTVFITVNRNKRSLLLDLKAAEAREALLRVVDRADVVIESFPPGVAKELGLTFDDLARRKPGLVVCSITAFGDGPLGAEMPGYDALVQAMSGMMSFTGHPHTPPVRLAPSVLDLSTGLWAAIGIMAALARRRPGSAAQHVRPSLLDSAYLLMCHQLLGFLATGQEPSKLGSGAPSAVPYGVFEASDGPLMIATATDAQFARLCEALGMPELAEDRRFRTMQARIAARQELDALLAERISQKTVSTWLERLSTARISAGPVNGFRQALESAVTAERGLLIAPETGGWPHGLPQLRLPIDPSGKGVRRPPPKLGEHSAEILREAGFDAGAIARLMSPPPEDKLVKRKSAR
jgi:crotonobetainyl-CoA:carnitine CoA-transferase CaiB-like acyl-CoA transferase